jgi:hypothetical protein
MADMHDARWPLAHDIGSRPTGTVQGSLPWKCAPAICRPVCELKVIHVSTSWALHYSEQNASFGHTKARTKRRSRKKMGTVYSATLYTLRPVKGGNVAVKMFCVWTLLILRFQYSWKVPTFHQHDFGEWMTEGSERGDKKGGEIYRSSISVASICALTTIC